MENEVRLIECRSCDCKNCNGCNLFTLAEMLHNRDFDCLMDEHKTIAFTPESLRPKGRWVDPEWNDMWQSMTATCSHCLERGEVRVRTNEYGMKVINSPCCPNCGADMRGEVDDK